MGSHYTKEDVVLNDFLFVSYKHEDATIVTDVIGFLLDQGVRLWYDEDLVIGEKWPEIAERLIKHEHCKGVLFFNSISSFKSEPVFMERAFTLEKIEACKKQSTPFLVFPINIGKPSTMLILKAVFESLPEDDREIEKIFPLKYLQGISSLFSSDTIYCYADPENIDEYRERLIANIKKALPSVIDKRALHEKEIVETLGTVRSTVSFGYYRGKQAGSLPGYFLSKDQRVDYQGKTYIVESGVAYEAQKISWEPIYCEDDKFVLLSQDVVDTRNGGDALATWLNDTFAKLAFTEDEQSQITKVRLLSGKDISKSQVKDLLVFEDSEVHWWLEDKGIGALQKVVKKDGTIYNSGYNFRTKKSGVRPVVCVHKDFLTSLKKN